MKRKHLLIVIHAFGLASGVAAIALPDLALVWLARAFLVAYGVSAIVLAGLFRQETKSE